MTHLHKQHQAYSKMYNGYGKVNHYKVVCKNAQKQTQSQNSYQRKMAIHKEQQEEEPYTWEQRDNRNNLVRMFLILFNTMKVEVFSQKQNLNFVERQAFTSFKHGFFQV